MFAFIPLVYRNRGCHAFRHSLRANIGSLCTREVIRLSKSNYADHIKPPEEKPDTKSAVDEFLAKGGKITKAPKDYKVKDIAYKLANSQVRPE